MPTLHFWKFDRSIMMSQRQVWFLPAWPGYLNVFWFESKGESRAAFQSAYFFICSYLYCVLHLPLQSTYCCTQYAFKWNILQGVSLSTPVVPPRYIFCCAEDTVRLAKKHAGLHTTKCDQMLYNILVFYGILHFGLSIFLREHFCHIKYYGSICFGTQGKAFVTSVSPTNQTLPAPVVLFCPIKISYSKE